MVVGGWQPAPDLLFFQELHSHFYPATDCLDNLYTDVSNSGLKLPQMRISLISYQIAGPTDDTSALPEEQLQGEPLLSTSSFSEVGVVGSFLPMMTNCSV